MPRTGSIVPGANECNNSNSLDLPEKSRTYHVDIPESLVNRTNDHEKWLIDLMIQFRSGGYGGRSPDTPVLLAKRYCVGALGRKYAPSIKRLVDSFIIERAREKDFNLHEACLYLLAGPLRYEQTVRVQLRSPELLKNLDKWVPCPKLDLRPDRGDGIDFDLGAECDPMIDRLRSVIANDLVVSSDYCRGTDPAIDDLLDGVIRCDPDKQGRVHSNITSIAARNRKYVHLRTDENPVQIDVSSCQPLTLGHHLQSQLTHHHIPNPSRTTSHSTSKEPNASLRHGTKIKVKVSGAAIPSGWAVAIQKHGADRLRDTLSRWIANCVTKVDGPTHLYARLMRETGEDRPGVKDRIWHVLYGSPIDALGCPVGQAIDRLYPGLLEMVAAEYDFPSKPPKGKKMQKSNKLPCAMQRIESDIVIRTAVRNFIAAYPAEPILTIHDAVVVRRVMQGAAKQLIEDAFREHLGDEIKVAVKPDDWRSEGDPHYRRVQED